MNIRLKDSEVLVFTHPHRTYDYQDYRHHHEEMILWSAQFNCEGMLCSTSSYDYFDPWLWAQNLCSKTENLAPFVAINPIYMHPFTAARMVASMVHLFGRKLWLNFITGSAPADLRQLNDTITKAQRYERLGEYAEVMLQLLKSQHPITYEGKYYQLHGATLMTQLTPDQIPGMTLGGESDDALNICEKYGMANLRMLAGGAITNENTTHKSLAFGIVTRATRQEAEAVGATLYPANRFGQKLLKISMAENETVWKARVYDELLSSSVGNELYWLEPFKNKYADCPYIMGSYEEIGEYIYNICLHKPHSFVLTIKNEEEFEHINHVFKMVEKRLL
jgi:alkanesulfonate monooxygenase